MDTDKRLIINELRTSYILEYVAHASAQRSAKSSKLSVQARKKGNTLFAKAKHSSREHEDIFRLYCKSIVSAPNESEELALGYGNRSALLFHLHKFDECICDIEKALKITKSSSLIEKLNKRKVKCLLLSNSLVDDSENKWKDKHFQCIQRAFDSILLEEPNLNILKNDDNVLTKETQENSLNSVAIRFNEKYGRHLVATRDIKPGEIFLKEKPYITCLNVRKPYTNCGHCLSVAWTGIPCEHCGYIIFCSEKCKIEAWNQYHDIECSLIPNLLHFMSFIYSKTGQDLFYDALSIRALLKGLRESGDLGKLNTEVQLIDKCTDKRTKGFSESGKFENNKFRSLYSLTTEIPANEIENHVKFAAMTLVCIAKCTSFFGKDYKFSDLENLIQNTDAIFVGSLLLKLSKISNINSHGLKNVNDDCTYQNDLATCRRTMCCIKGFCIVPIGSLINHSCNPNARRCFNSDLDLILYALQPIQKNSQIFDSYICTFFDMPNPHRQNLLRLTFQFKCDCIACKEHWPFWTIADKSLKELLCSIKLSKKELEIWKITKDIIESVENKTAYFNQDLIQNISRAIETSIKYLNQPSVITYKLIMTLIIVFERLCGYQLDAFDRC